MKKIHQKYLVSIVLFAVFISGIFIFGTFGLADTYDGKETEGTIGSVSYYFYNENFTDSDSESYNDNYTYMISAKNIADPTKGAYYLVNEKIFYNYTWSHNYSYYYFYLYNDKDQSALKDAENLSMVEDFADSINGDECFYQVSIWVSQNTYVETKNVTYTFYEIVDEDGDGFEDYDETTGDYILGPMVNGSKIEKYIEWVDEETGEEYYDGFFDSYFGNRSMDSYEYSDCYYGYDADQSIYTYQEAADSANYTYFDLYNYWSGYTIYKDKNGNGYMDMKIYANPNYNEELPDSETNSPYIFNKTTFEPEMSVYYLNFSTYEISMPSIVDGKINFTFELKGINAILTPYGMELGEALYLDEFEDPTVAKEVYIPSEKISFSYTWNQEKGNFATKNYIGTYQTSKTNTSVPLYLTNLSLAIDYWGWIDTYASSWSFNDNATGGNQTTVETELIEIKVGNQPVVAINATGTYLYNNNQTKNMTLIMIPEESISILYSDEYQDENGSDKYESTYSSTWYSFSLCFNTWNGRSIEMDPTFTTYFSASVLPNGDHESDGISGYDVVLLLGIASFTGALLIKRKIQ
jgi:hypothetical protein